MTTKSRKSKVNDIGMTPSQAGGSIQSDSEAEFAKFISD